MPGLPVEQARTLGRAKRGFAMISLRKFSNAGFNRGVPRWREATWTLVRCLFFETPVPLPSAMKVALLRCFGAKIGRGVVVRSQVRISFPWRLEVGNDVWIGDGVWILSLAKVTLQANVCLSQRCYLCTGSHDYRRETFDLITRPIEIRQGSWVAAGAFVGPGVTVGPGAVVAAGAVVTAPVPPRCLVRGNPAEVVKEISEAVQDARSYS
jgi:putative colanic acid biosynthesis acetyltransferase WcaF